LSLRALLVIALALVGVNLLIFLAVILLLAARRGEAKKRERLRRDLLNFLEPLLSRSVDFFDQTFVTSMLVLGREARTRQASQVLEDLLLEYIKNGNEQTRRMARNVAYHFGFPEACADAINGLRPDSVALACRKAGVYQFSDAVPDMLKALRLPSGDVQFQVLMALSRLADARAMAAALDLLDGRLFLNQQALAEIRGQFTGELPQLGDRIDRLSLGPRVVTGS